MEKSVIFSLRIRIGVLYILSALLLAGIGFLFYYGFKISEDARSRTADDLTDIKNASMKAQLQTGIISDKIRISVLDSKLNAELKAANKNLSQPISVNGTTYYVFIQLFRLEAKDLRDFPMDDGFSDWGFPLEVPDSCRSLTKFSADEELTSYPLQPSENSALLFSDDLQRAATVSVNVQMRSTSAKEPQLPSRNNKQKKLTPGSNTSLPFADGPISVVDRQGIRSTVQSKLNEACQTLGKSQVISDIQQTISGIDDKIRKDSGVQAPKPAGQDEIFLLLINRFAPLVIIFFFVSLLISIYRYNSRLISYYYARIDVLKLTTGPLVPEAFAAAVTSFSPDAVDFGRTPRTPVDLAADIAGKVVDKLKT